ncbi:unnamed protein product, partial [Prorocentrum cordatum]
DAGLEIVAPQEGSYCAVHFCESCRDWFAASLPNVSFEDVAREMQGDEAKATEISDAINGDADADEANGGEDEETLNVAAYQHEEIGTWIQDEFDLLSYTDVASITGKTPAQNKLKPIKRKAPTGNIETRYPFATRKFPRLLVFTKQSSALNADIAKPCPRKFASQGSMILGAMRKADAASSGVGSWCRLHCLDDDSVQPGFAPPPDRNNPMVSPAATKQKIVATPPSASGQPASGVTEIVPFTGTDSGDSVEFIGGQTASESMGTDSQAELAIALTESKNDSLAAMHWPTLTKPRKVEHLQVVKSPTGTVQHWIERSPLEEVQLGDGKQRERNQLDILKRKVSTSELNQIENHWKLIDAAKDTWTHHLMEATPTRMDEIGRAIRKSGYSLTPACQLNFLHVHYSRAWDAPIESSDTARYIGDIMSLLRLWRTTDEKFDHAKPCLGAVDMSDSQCNEYFLNYVVDRIATLFLADETKAALAVELCSSLLKAWELPEEDAIISRARCETLVAIKRVASVVVFLDDMGSALQEDMHGVFDDVLELESQRHQSRHPTIFSVTGAALASSLYWGSKLEKGANNAKKMKEISTAEIAKLLKLVDMVPKIEVEMDGTGAARKYEGEVVAKVVDASRRLVGMARDIPQTDAEERDRIMVLFTAFAEVISLCSRVCAQSESIKVALMTFKTARGNFTADLKFAALRDSMDKFLANACEGLGVNVFHALSELRGQELPIDIGDKLSKCVELLLSSGLLFDKECMCPQWLGIIEGMRHVQSSGLSEKWKPVLTVLAAWKATCDCVKTIRKLGAEPESRILQKSFAGCLQDLQTAEHKFRVSLEKPAVKELLPEDADQTLQTYGGDFTSCLKGHAEAHVAFLGKVAKASSDVLTTMVRDVGMEQLMDAISTDTVNGAMTKNSDYLDEFSFESSIVAIRKMIKAWLEDHEVFEEAANANGSTAADDSDFPSVLKMVSTRLLVASVLKVSRAYPDRFARREAMLKVQSAIREVKLTPSCLGEHVLAAYKSALNI